jgi:predicted HTH transcriptional regulator
LSPRKIKAKQRIVNMRFRFNPFEGQLSEVLPSALKNLYAVSEGWYVEYKSQPIPVKAIAKSLSAFANQYGGWLIIGIEEDPQTHVAKSFPGVEESNVGALLQSIREASKDVLNPEVYFETSLVDPLVKTIIHRV